MVIGRKIVFGLILVWLGLGLVQLWAVNRLATHGEALKDFQVMAEGTEEDNRQLQNRLARLGSLRRVASESAKLGLAKTDKIVYLSLSPKLALQRED